MNSAVWLFYWKKIEGRFKMIQIIENKRLSEEEINLLSDALRVSDKSFAEVYRDVSGKEVKKCVEIGDFEEAETGRMLKVYTDKNGLLTI